MTRKEIINAGMARARISANYGTENQRMMAKALAAAGYREEAFLLLGLGKVREEIFMEAYNWGGANHLATIVNGETQTKILSVWFEDEFIDD